MVVSPSAAPQRILGYVEVPFTVADSGEAGYFIHVENHRELAIGEGRRVTFVRPVSESDVAQAISVWVTGQGQLTSGTAYYPAGETTAFLSCKPTALGESRIIASTPSGDGVFMSMPLRAVGTDELQEPLPQDSGPSHSCVFSGGAGSGANPLTFCGDCAWFDTPVAPPQCGGRIAGESFVQHGRCESDWVPNLGCRHWEPMTVAAPVYVLTAGAALVDCRWSINIDIISWTPQKKCCTWNIDPAQPPVQVTYNQCRTMVWNQAQQKCD